jgi:ABC-type transport system involved in cytochrome bd biosynthesis fused ATPase/permease subunit
VDSATDKKIQDTIREAFRGCTILTIAHRLETIADYDRVVVMRDGRVAEYDAPHALLQREAGLFRGLVDQLGPEIRASFVKTALARAHAATATTRADSKVMNA